MGSPFRLLVMAMSMTVTASAGTSSPAAAMVVAVAPARAIAALPGFISAFVPAFVPDRGRKRPVNLILRAGKDPSHRTNSESAEKSTFC